MPEAGDERWLHALDLMDLSRTPAVQAIDEPGTVLVTRSGILRSQGPFLLKNASRPSTRLIRPTGNFPISLREIPCGPGLVLKYAGPKRPHGVVTYGALSANTSGSRDILPYSPSYKNAASASYAGTLKSLGEAHKP